MSYISNEPGDDYFVSGIHDVENLSPERFYFDEAMAAYELGKISLAEALDYIPKAVARHYDPQNNPEAVMPVGRALPLVFLSAMIAK